jgi:hypothetical protein
MRRCRCEQAAAICWGTYETGKTALQRINAERAAA